LILDILACVLSPVSLSESNIVYELEIGKPLLESLCNTDLTPSELRVEERG
jgi:hypothetical protein